MVLIGISLMTSDVEPLDICWPSVCNRLQKYVYSDLLSFFFFILSCVSSLYILDINHSSDKCLQFASIFSHSVLFHFVDGSLCCVEAFDV